MRAGLPWRSLVSLACVASICASANAAAQAPRELFTKAARLAVIDKHTADKQVLRVRAGQSARAQDMEFFLMRCWIEGAKVLPEHAALLEITQHAPRTPPESLFSGWLFARRQEISNLEHPRVDVRLLGCEQAQAPQP